MTLNESPGLWASVSLSTYPPMAEKSWRGPLEMCPYELLLIRYTEYLWEQKPDTTSPQETPVSGEI
jgi:hypothetical protein